MWGGLITSSAWCPWVQGGDSAVLVLGLGLSWALCVLAVAVSAENVYLQLLLLFFGNFNYLST